MNAVEKGWDINLSDMSPGMVQEAHDNLRVSRRGFGFATIDVQSIPFADQTFDAVIANHMLYHVPDRDRAFCEIRRVLRRDGRFYASTNGPQHLIQLERLIKTIDPDADWSSSSEFGLQNGKKQLSRWFNDVSMHRYESSLVVTEPGPIITYLSSTRWSGLVESRLQELTEAVGRVIEAKGAFHISTDSGILEAQGEADRFKGERH